jgi:hypothetical protein
MSRSPLWLRAFVGKLAVALLGAPPARAYAYVPIVRPAPPRQVLIRER